MADKIYVRLRVAIMSGQLAPGQKLIYRTLAEEMGVSPTPVRDAVHRLMSDGILVMDERGAAALPEPDPVRFIEIISLRIDLEGRAASYAAAVGGEAAARELEVLHEQLEDARTKGLTHLALEINEQFHFAVISSANMPVLEGLLRSLWLLCGPSLRFLHTDDAPKLGLRHPHYKMIAAIRAKDSLGARNAIREDLVSHGRHILGKIYETLGQEVPTEPPAAWVNATD
ncbi:FCD domain protein [Brucella lupini]|uniref:FCD domain protein n=1 Tax=Brucella lupini TaxID=255457 RepID=A0A256GCU6_9HYPH|nr:FCD domain protein [Brucella lupini]